jgi:hypothetical protein
MASPAAYLRSVEDQWLIHTSKPASTTCSHSPHPLDALATMLTAFAPTPTLAMVSATALTRLAVLRSPPASLPMVEPTALVSECSISWIE